MFVTEDGNTRGRATLRDGHIAVGDVVRYGPCFFLIGQYEDGYNGCRYWRFGSRVKILMLTSEHTAFKFMINKHVEERNHALVLQLFRFPGFTTIWSVLRESRLGTLKEDIMFIAYGGAKETRIHLLKMQLSALETWKDLVWKKLPWWLWFILWLTNLFVKVRLLEEPPEHFGGWCDRTVIAVLFHWWHEFGGVHMCMYLWRGFGITVGLCPQERET